MSQTSFLQAERAHYNKQAERHLDEAELTQIYTNFQREITTTPLRLSYQAWLAAVQALTVKPGNHLLDYCSGQGYHSVTMQKLHPQVKVVGFDISDVSVAVATRMAKAVLGEGLIPEFTVMDAHQLSYTDNSFEFVSDFGSLSSLDFVKAMHEVLRVLKSGGTFIGIETFGHNPLTNLKRKLNVLFGKRTEWAAQNILRTEHLVQMQKMFEQFQVQYFGLSTLLLPLIPGRPLGVLKIFESVDGFLFKALPFLKRFAFKVVFVGKK